MATSITTTVNRTTELVSTTSVAFIRPITLTINASLLKPYTKMYAFFDGIDVNRFFTPSGGALGDQLVTDVDGNLVATFQIPEMTFTTGEKELVILDYEDYTVLSTSGTAVVKATAKFSSRGTLQTYQSTETTTITTTITEPPPPPRNYDPLAQSFFTYGVTGGCFITAIDLYFSTKDSTLPVWVELREMVNGYPGPKLLGDHAISIVKAADVLVSSTAATATRFEFGQLIYLQQDKDYCFVVRSNSSKYNLWTSKLGETSKETGKTVFQQPYMGSLFKSENNITWTAEQTEDIKFVMYRADFDTANDANIQLALRPNSIAVDSSMFQTFKTSGNVYVNFPFKHGLKIDSRLAIATDASSTFNGITSAQLNGDFAVTDVVSEYVAGFYVPGAAATSTGPITTGGRIKDIIITDGGSGYDAGSPPTFTFTGGGSNAAATAVISNGEIVDVIMTNEGSGYTGAVTVTINSAVGSGATASAVVTPRFTVTTNRIYHSMTPVVYNIQPEGTSVKSTLSTTTGSFEGGNLVHYAEGKTYELDLNDVNSFDSNLLIASRFNEIDLMGGSNSTQVDIVAGTTNSNVSPIIDLSKTKMLMRTNSINNQKNEVIASTNSSGYVTGITLVGGGSGYDSAPTVIISGTGTGATATCTISGGIVDSLTLVDGGSGYYGTVKVAFSGGTPTTYATATATLSDYNSELKSNYGNALSRYVTKAQRLQNVSYGIRLYATAFSNADSSFDVYVKTSLSSANQNHDNQEWQQLSCLIDRNRSANPGQFLDYEFIKDNIEPFDVYSVKFVLRTTTPWQPPVINNYRVIVLA